MNHIKADEFDYYLTDKDYVTISEKLKDDIYGIFWRILSRWYAYDK